MQLRLASDILEVYTLEELLEYNDYTPEEFLTYCVELGLLELPDPRPLDFDDA